MAITVRIADRDVTISPLDLVFIDKDGMQLDAFFGCYTDADRLARLDALKSLAAEEIASRDALADARELVAAADAA